MMSGAASMQDGLEGLSGDAFDQAYLRLMIMHHSMGVVMTRPVAAGATHPELRALAEQIIADQTREIGQMRAWLKEWYDIEMPDPLAMMGAMPARGPMMSGGMMSGSMMGDMMSGGMMGQRPGMAGMAGMGMMAHLAGLPPARMEAVFMSMMIPHHQDAIDMSTLAAGRAAHTELTALAAGIVSSQGAEIASITGWLKEWYGL